MHYHAEVIIPPVAPDKVESVIEQIMAPYSEYAPGRTDRGFYDWYVIGGRFAGKKLLANIDRTRLDEFYDRLNQEKITVSGVTAGKQELSPASQESFVDALWRDYFPESGFDICPLFKHSNDQYDSDSLIIGDICTMKELPRDLKCDAVIFGAHAWDGNGYEMSESVFEYVCAGASFLKTSWDCNVWSAVFWMAERCRVYYSDDFKKDNGITEDWLAVTVDYHS